MCSYVQDLKKQLLFTVYYIISSMFVQRFVMVQMNLSSFFQDDEKFLTELFAQLTDEATDDDKRHELV